MLRPFILFLSLSISPFTIQSSPVLIVAHRGASADAPENTLPAFELAWQQGADAIEGDFHLTRDRQIVCIHDTTTGKYASKNLTVRKSTLGQLKSLDVGSWHSPEFEGTQIPTLTEVLATIPPDKKLFLEIKSSPKIVRHILKEIDESSISPEQIVIISFSGRVIKTVKTRRPSLKAILLSPARRKGKADRLTPTPKQILARLRRSRADGLSIYRHPDIDASYLAPILEAGYELHTWTLKTPHGARRWITLGALSLTTDTPGKLRSELTKER